MVTGVELSAGPVGSGKGVAEPASLVRGIGGSIQKARNSDLYCSNLGSALFLIGWVLKSATCCPSWGKFGIRAIFPYQGFRPETFTLLDGKFMV